MSGRRVRRHQIAVRFFGGDSGRSGRLCVFSEAETGFDRARIVVGNRNDRLAEQSELIGGEPGHRLREQLNLLGQGFRFDLQFIELGQHQLFRLIAPRFFLALAHNDVAQHFILFCQLGCFFRRGADQLDLLKLLACFVEL